ncbi:MAG TPA: hypothetical protein VGC54_14580 [Planctomycetota bacterium]
MSGLSRRHLLGAGSAAGALGLMTAVRPGLLPGWLRQDPAAAPLRLGTGKHTYEWVADWVKLPAGRTLGNTHGCMVSDSKGRIVVNTDTEHAVLLFDADGRLLNSWGKELAGGAHGMAVLKEGESEFLYLTHTGRGELLKCTLEGEVLWRLGVPTESGHYENPNQYKPTSVAVAPDGRIFVADGYGLSWVHLYSPERKYLRSIGGPGAEPGQMRTPHGLWMDSRRGAPMLTVADRENHRLQYFDLDGEHLGMLDHDLRRPCHAHQHGSDLVVADLAGRVSIFDAEDKLVTHLGDQPDPAKRANNGVARELWQTGEFISPHCAHWDASGDLYVMDWLSAGRLTKLRRVGIS